MTEANIQAMKKCETSEVYMGKVMLEVSSLCCAYRRREAYLKKWKEGGVCLNSFGLHTTCEDLSPLMRHRFPTMSSTVGFSLGRTINCQVRMLPTVEEDRGKGFQLL